MAGRDPRLKYLDTNVDYRIDKSLVLYSGAKLLEFPSSRTPFKSLEARTLEFRLEKEYTHTDIHNTWSIYIYIYIHIYVYLSIYSFIFIHIFFMYDMPWSWFCLGDIPFHFPDPAAQAVAGWNLWRGCGSWIILPAKFRSSSQISMWSGVPAQKKTVYRLLNERFFKMIELFITSLLNLEGE